MVFKNGDGRKGLEKDKTVIVEGKPKGVLSFNIFEHLLHSRHFCVYIKIILLV